MAIRIWHQSFTVMNDIPSYLDALTERIPQVIRPGTEVSLYGTMPGSFSSDYPGPDMSFAFLNTIHTLQWMAAAREAERQGFDAFVLGTLSSPMASEIRTIVDIPVVGYGEAVFNAAGLFGRKTGLLFYNKDRRDFWGERVKLWGLGDRFVGLGHTGITHHDVHAALADPSLVDGVVSKIVEAGERMVREQGADVIVIGEMQMNLLVVRAGITRLGGATVMDGMATLYKTAEMLVDLRRTSGTASSRTGYYHASPGRERIDHACALYGLDGIGKKLSFAGVFKATSGGSS